MDIKWIEDFLFLVETQNFSVAAEKRCITQSAYSRRIKALEEWVGVALFDRSSHPITLTERGENFQAYAEKIRAEINQLQSEFSPLKKDKKSEIRILTLQALTFHYMPEHMANFNFEDKKIRITARLTGQDAYYNNITDGLADLFLTYDLPELHRRLMQTQHIKSCIVGEEKIIPVIAANKAKNFNWGSPQKIPHLIYENESFIGTIVEERISKFKNKLNTVYEADLSEALLHVALQGKGVAWLPYAVCKKELERQSLMILQGPDLIINCNIMAYINTKKADALATKFWTYLKNSYAEKMLEAC